MNKLVPFFTVVAILLTGCNEDPVPRPRGYFHIELPEKTYHRTNPDCPFTFDIPDYSRMQFRTDRNECWFNLDFPNHRGRIHFTYRPVEGNLRQLLDESHQLSYEHHVKANDIITKVVNIDSTCVFGLIYNLTGDVASPLQFYVTDSTSHFLRGSLYFNAAANGDSLQPVVDFIAADVDHLVETLRWQSSTCN